MRTCEFGTSAALLAGRGLGPPWSSVIILSGLSWLPDADVLGFAFGVAYADPFGHRGATHSLAFAILIAVVCALGARRFQPSKSALRVAALVGVVVASHGLLDMLTDGGLGVALFFPLSEERLFFPWRPIPGAPIGRGMLSSRGLFVAATETAYTTPSSP